MTKIYCLIDDVRSALDHLQAELAEIAPHIPLISPTTTALGQMATTLYHLRGLRDRYFDGEIFRDPAWDIMLDLFAARERGRSVSVSSATIAARVPPTTGLRWLTLLERRGLVRRRPEGADGRRIIVELTDAAEEQMRAYLLQVAASEGRAVAMQTTLGAAPCEPAAPVKPGQVDGLTGPEHGAG